MEMDWGEEEEERPPTTPRDIWDEEKGPLKKEKSKLSDESPKSAVKNKFADIMAKQPTPPPSPKVIIVYLCMWADGAHHPGRVIHLRVSSL